jgi:hypothetical protein
MHIIEESTVVSRHEQKFFFASDASTSALGHTQLPIQRSKERRSHSIASSSDFQNDKGYASNSPYALK